MNARTLVLILIALGFTVNAGDTRASGTYSIRWFTIDGGGGDSSAGSYELAGTIGQSDAGVMSGGLYTLAGGFWSGGNLTPSDVEDPLDEDVLGEGALAFRVHGPATNPFRPATNMRFDLPAKCHVRIEIYAVTGSRVKTLLDQEMTAGTHSVRWNGRSDRGTRVGSGVYLLRTKAGEWLDTRKITLLD